MRGNPLPVLITIFKSLSQGEKPVTYGGQKANRKNLIKWHEVDIQPSTYYHHRKTCKDNGWIRTRCRYKNGIGREIRRRTDMVTVKLKGAILLAKAGIEGARKLVAYYLKRRPPTDQRFPDEKGSDDGSYRPEDPGERARLNALLEGVTKEMEE